MGDFCLPGGLGEKGEFFKIQGGARSVGYSLSLGF